MDCAVRGLEPVGDVCGLLCALQCAVSGPVKRVSVGQSVIYRPTSLYHPVRGRAYIIRRSGATVAIVTKPMDETALVIYSAVAPVR